MSATYFEGDAITIYHGDCQVITPGLLDNSVDLFIEDWPYYKVKGEWWDRQWDKPEAFLDWVAELCQERQRLLKPNGSLYAFASPQMAHKVRDVLEQYFNVLNVIRWYKDEGWHKKADPEALRSYLEPWEAVILAEHHGVESYAKGEAGYVTKCDELRGFVFESLRAYLDGERKCARVNFEQVRQMVGCATGSGLPSHWFTCSQWMLPTAENYAKLQVGFNHDNNGQEYKYLRREYEDLRREYEDLRREYEDLRRPFFASADRHYTDVWTYRTVSDFPGKHPAEKPLAMIEDIIRISSRPNAVVADFFMGRGTTARAAANLGRQFIGGDIMEKWCKATVDRVAQASFLPILD